MSDKDAQGLERAALTVKMDYEAISDVVPASDIKFLTPLNEQPFGQRLTQTHYLILLTGAQSLSVGEFIAQQGQRRLNELLHRQWGLVTVDDAEPIVTLTNWGYRLFMTERNARQSDAEQRGK